jgi:hypothetical protein
VRSIQTFFTHRPVSTLDRVHFQLTGEPFLYGMPLSAAGARGAREKRETSRRRRALRPRAAPPPFPRPPRPKEPSFASVSRRSRDDARDHRDDRARIRARDDDRARESAVASR